MSQAGSTRRTATFAIGVAALAALGWWIGTHTAGPAAPGDQASEEPATTPLRKIPAPQPRATKSGRNMDGSKFDLDALLNEALPGERTLTFKSDEAMRRFLASLEGSGFRLLGSIPELRTLRVGFDDPSLLENLPDDIDDPGFVFPVYVPNPPPADAQAGAQAIGSGLPEWLGITGDNSAWGAGVTVAILDTGVAAHSSLTTNVTSNNLVALPDDLSAQHGHGTAVASIIAGSHSLIPGVAPAAELLSIRVADDNGISDSFTLAQGVMAAMAGGADIINISLGSYGNSGVLHDAIVEATNAGIVIVAAAGNDGQDRITYPAAYPEVVGVGAVDAAGSYLEFSNTGEELSATAPGFGVNAAWPDEGVISFTGTSASAPVIAGAIAAVMSPGDGSSSSALHAASDVLDHLNEAGYPGEDPLYGDGMVDVGRVMRSGTPGIVDAALASTVLSYPEYGGPPQILVTVENRGTEMLVNAAVTVSSGAGSTPLNVTTLPPGAIRTFSVPVPNSAFDDNQEFRVQTSVRLGEGGADDFPANDSRIDSFTLTDAE
jgi:hypothetical protein